MGKYIDILVVGVLIFIGVFYESLTPSYAIENNGVYYDNVRYSNNVKLNNVNGLDIDYSAELEKPGDSFELIFDVVNSENYDVSISDYFINDNDDYISYYLTYSDGSLVNIGDIIKKGEKKELKYKVLYRNQVISTDYTFDTSFSLNFEQAL